MSAVFYHTFLSRYQINLQGFHTFTLSNGSSRFSAFDIIHPPDTLNMGTVIDIWYGSGLNVYLHVQRHQANDHRRDQ